MPASKTRTRPGRLRRWVLRAALALIFVVNVQCALSFVLNPAAFADAYELTGASTWLRQAEAQFAYIRRAFVDPRPNSEWFWSLTESGVPTDKPIVEEWKCPYHNSRMCLRVIEHLA